MGQVLYTAAPPRWRQSVEHTNTQESLRALAKLRINQKTVAKWKQRKLSPIFPQARRKPNRTCFPSRRRRPSSLSGAIPTAFRRLPLCAAADHAASDGIIAASLSPTVRHQSIAGDRRPQTVEERTAYRIGYFHIEDQFYEDCSERGRPTRSKQDLRLLPSKLTGLSLDRLLTGQISNLSVDVSATRWCSHPDIPPQDRLLQQPIHSTERLPLTSDLGMLPCSGALSSMVQHTWSCSP